MVCLFGSLTSIPVYMWSERVFFISFIPTGTIKVWCIQTIWCKYSFENSKNTKTDVKQRCCSSSCSIARLHICLCKEMHSVVCLCGWCVSRRDAGVKGALWWRGRLRLCHFSAQNKRLVTTSSLLVLPSFSKTAAALTFFCFWDDNDFLFSDQTCPTFVSCWGLINPVLVS